MSPTETTPQLYDEKYFAAQISKSDEKAAYQYGKLLRYAGVTAQTHPALLDAGCGAGPALAYLQKEGYRVVASDFIFFPLLEAHKRAPTVPLLSSDLNYGLPFADATFDIILASEVVEHLAQAEVFLQDAGRVLKPGGVLLLTTPNLWDIRRLFTGKNWSGYRDPTHINLLTPHHLQQLLAQAGFSSVNWKTGIKPAFARSFRKVKLKLEIPYPPVIGNGIMAAARKA